MMLIYSMGGFFHLPKHRHIIIIYTTENHFSLAPTHLEVISESNALRMRKPTKKFKKKDFKKKSKHETYRFRLKYQKTIQQNLTIKTNYSGNLLVLIVSWS